MIKIRTIIAGSRNINSITIVRDAMKAAKQQEDIVPTVVVSGVADGVDKKGIIWAEENGLPVTKFPAMWDKYKKKAGFIRNSQMADNADALVAIWDGISSGTDNMINIARIRGLKIFIWFINPPKSKLFK